MALDKTIRGIIRPRWVRALAAALFGVAVVAGIAAVYLHRGAVKAGTTDATAAQGSAPPVAVTPVIRADLSNTLTLAAEFRPFQEVNVYARVAGYVQQMKVDVGDRVKAGDVLAVLEIPELQDDLRRATAAVERAEHEVIRAKASYDEAHLAYGRLSEVLEQQPNLVAQQDIDQARARDETLKASWDAAQHAAREAVANRDKYATMVAYSRITAPFGGVVTKRYADTGSLLGAGTSSSGQALVRLSQLDPLRLILPLPESDVPNIRVGMPVQVLVHSTQEQLAATVTRVSGEVAADTRTMHIEVDVPNPRLTMAPGMYASAVLTQESRKQALLLPIEAVPDRKGDTALVYVLNRQNKIEERQITVGIETATQLEVKSGVEENELVLLGGRGQYQPGQSATPKLVAQAAPR